MSISTVLIAAIAVLTWLCPFSLLYVWILTFLDSENREEGTLKWRLSALILVSSAVGVYWMSAFWEPPVATPEWDWYFWRWARISVSAAIAAFVLELFDRGKEKPILMATSATVPLSWMLTKVLE